MYWKNRGPSRVRGISPLIATLLLIMITIVGGSLVYVAFSSQASSVSGSAEFQVQSLDAVKAGGVGVASATVKNVGTVKLTSVTVTIKATTDISIDIGSIEPGNTGSGEADASALTAGETYPVTITADSVDGSHIEKSMTVRVRSS